MIDGPTELDDLYRTIILDHHRRPRNRQPLPDASVAAEGVNPLCGDEVHVQLGIDGDRIDRVAAWGKGCSISQSSASLMTEAIADRSVVEAERLKRAFEEMMTVATAEPAEELGDLIALEGVHQFPVRIKCAVLAWKVLEEALTQYAGKAPATTTTE